MLLYGVTGVGAFICSAKTEPGRVNHQCYGSINLANYSCKDEVTFENILKDFTDAGIPAASVPYDEARWKKASGTCCSMV